jgi:dehydrogenase/reductase SDR family protein 13
MSQGATGGIGREVALDCASRGAKVVLGCRSQIRAEATVAYIKSRTGNDDVHYVTVDMASLQSVKEFVDEFCKYHNKLDVLINNAGKV